MKGIFSTRPGWAVLLGWILLLAGCAADPLARIRADFDAGRYGDCARELASARKEHPGDAHLYALDQGIVHLALRAPKKTLADLRFARDRMDELAGKTFFESFKSLFLDDRQLDYVGADYERVLVRAVLALADLAARAGDAASYALQVLQEQMRIIDSYKLPDGKMPKKAYKLVAFGSYVRAIMAEEDPLSQDLAEREYRKVLEIEPGFAYGKEDLERVRQGRLPPKGYGVIHVLVLCGRGPFRVETRADPKDQAWADAMGLAQAVWAVHKKRVAFPLLSAVKIPALAFYRENPTEVHVDVDGREEGVTAVVTDVEATAEAEFKAMRPEIIARALIRRAFKIAVTEGVKAAVRKGEKKESAKNVSDLLVSLGGLLWISSERADLRCWDLLPASFQVLRLEVPAGVHTVTLRAGLSGRPTGEPQSVRVFVRDGYNTYVVALVPTLRGGPEPLTSRPAPEDPCLSGKPGGPLPPPGDGTREPSQRKQP